MVSNLLIFNSCPNMRSLGLLTIFLLTYVSGYVTDTDADTERVYEYYGETYTWNNVTKQDVSRWNIYAKLTYQTKTDYDLVKLDKVQVLNFNGHEYSVDKVKKIDIPEDAAILMHPFVFYHNGSIGLSEDDPNWSFNMKKAIASILLFDHSVLKEPGIVQVNETNLYGLGEISYVVQYFGNKIKVDKLLEISRFGGEKASGYTANNYVSCSGVEHSTVTRDISRTYYLNDKTNLNKIDRIEATNYVTFAASPSDPQPVHVKQFQSFDLKYFGKIRKAIEVPANLVVKDLQYEHGSETMEGRSKEEEETKTEDAVEKNVEHLHDMRDALGNKTIENTRTLSSSLDNIFASMLGSSYDALEETLNKVQDDKVAAELFLSVLPVIGTNQSIEFIMNLVKQDEIEDHYLIKLLTLFPKYANKYSQDLVDSLKSLLYLKRKNKLIENSIYLSYASLLPKMYERSDISEDEYVKYITDFMELFKSKIDYGHKMTLLLAMNNMAVPYDTWVPLIEEEDISEHLRILATTLVVRTLKDEEDKVKIKNTFFPILKNESLLLELRARALDVLVEADLGVEEFEEIYQYLHEETDDVYHQHLYHYLFSSLASYAINTKCVTPKSDLVVYLEKMKKPESDYSFITGNYRIGFTNRAADFGRTIHLKTFGDPIAKDAVAFEFSTSTFKFMIETKHKVHVKLYGLKDDIVKKVIGKGAKNVKHLGDFINIIKKNKLVAKKGHDLHIEVIVFNDDNAVFSTYFNKKTLTVKNFTPYLLELFQRYIGDATNVYYPMFDYTYVPSDLGTDISFFTGEEIVTYQNTENMEHLFEMEKDFSIQWRVYNAHYKGSEIYHPILNTKLGANNIVYHNLYSELSFNFTKDEDDEPILQLDPHSFIFTAKLETDKFVGALHEELLNETCAECSDEYIYEDKDGKKFSRSTNFPLFGQDIKVSIDASSDDYDTQTDVFRSAMTDVVGNYEVFPPSKLYFAYLYVLFHENYLPKWNDFEIALDVRPVIKDPVLIFIDLFGSHKVLRNTAEALPGEHAVFGVDVHMKKVEDQSTVKHVVTKFILHEEPGLLNQSFGIHVDVEKEHKHAKVCLDMDISVPAPDADFYSLKPVDDSNLKVHVKFGPPTDTPYSNCTDSEFPIDVMFNVDFSVLDEQKEHALAADVSPFKECKKDSEGFKYTAPTKACIEAAHEMSTYRFIDIKMYTDVDKIEKKLSEEWGKQTLAGVPQELEVTLEFPHGGPARLNYTLPGNIYSGTSLVWAPKYYYPYIDDDLLFRPQDIWEDFDDFAEMGVTSTCIITDKFVTTFAGKTVQTDLKKDTEYVGMVECKNAREAILYKQEKDHKLGVRIWLSGIDISAKPKADGKGMKVAVDDEDLAPNEWRSVGDVRAIYMPAQDVVVIKGSTTQVYFNLEYIRVESYASYVENLCGICSEQANLVEVKH